MFLPPRKKNLATYSKKAPRVNHRSTFASPTSEDRHCRKRRVTLTSPARAKTSPTSSSSISLSPSVLGSHHEDDQVQQVETKSTQSKTRRRSQLPTELFPAHELAFSSPSEQIASPVSSSEHDSISDHDLRPVDRSRKKCVPRGTKPQPLSKLRQSLNIRPKKLQFNAKQPTSVLSAETIREIERGADGFDDVHLVLVAGSKPKSRKPKSYNTTAALNILKGPHPHVDFDDPDWLAVPYQDHHIPEQKETYHTAEATKYESNSQGEVIGNAHKQAEEFRSPLKPPTRPSAKEVLVYAQLSSVSAPIVRRPSYDEESEENYANNLMESEEDGEELERGMSDEGGMSRAGTVR